MSSRKQEENLKDKIKNLFSRKKDTAAVYKGPSKDVTPVFTSEILKEIGPESPSNNRIKTIKEMSDVVLKKKLEQTAIEAVWCSIQDLVLPQTASEKRHVVLHFLQCLLEGQYNQLGMMKVHFFNVILSLQLQENVGEKLSLARVLTEGGKSLSEIEDTAGFAFLEWFPTMVAAGKTAEFLPLIISAIKFNAAYLEENVMSGIIRETCKVCSWHKTPAEDVKLCLEILDAILCYSYLPSSTLPDVVAALCRMVNNHKSCEPSWELMRKLLGTHLGHSCIHIMCTLLQESLEHTDPNVLRGAIFYIGMSLWGSRKVVQLKHTPSAVLPSFLHVLYLGNPMISYEVTLSVQRLVKKYGKEIPRATWDIILDILEMVLRQLEQATDLSGNPRTPADLHDTLTAIEQLAGQGSFSGSIDRFFGIVELCTAKRPETSVILLISHLAKTISPDRDNWISFLFHILDKYFKHETRTKIRLKALEVLSLVLNLNKKIAEEELINSVVLPQLCHIETDSDANVRKAAMEILLSLLHHCSPPCFSDIITILEKVLSRPMVGHQLSPFPMSEGTDIVLDETHLLDIKATVVPLVCLFKEKLCAFPPGLYVRLYGLLIGHLADHYTTPKNYTSHTAAAVRKMIIECLLSLRADVDYRVGVYEPPGERRPQYSPYLTCDPRCQALSPPRSPVTTAPPPTTLWINNAYVDYSKAFTLFMQCLESEHDWCVLYMVLENLPLLLQNKTIILSAREIQVDSLCSRLCAMVNDRQLGFPEKLVGTPKDFTRSDFHATVFPVLAAMSTYHNYLDRNRQRELIKCLEFGMVSKCAKLCVNALRLCTLEIQEVMMRLLPSVLLKLTQISATFSMAIPVLAFLSSIVRLPKMYANFVEEQYMCIFAIALPYTNPFKFSHYTVSLAHHVIAIWFIRCRMAYRRKFVEIIQKGLKDNVLQQFEENARQALQSQNQDSSERVRSGSYSEAALRSRRRMQSGSAVSRSEVNAPIDNRLSQFHRELTETCTDIMARYTFGNFSALPRRSHMAEFLLTGGQSQTWLLGNKLVTITTSGSGTKAPNSGVCEKCQALYQQPVDQRDHRPGRRRHKSAMVSRSVSVVDPPVLWSSQDDMTVNPRSSQDDMVLDLDMTGQDAAVQTGSSLGDGNSLIESEPLESLILGMKNVSSHQQFPINVCNCWCTNWAEIYVRAPSGNLSWMMRIENESGMYNTADSQVPDITMLFASMGKKRSQAPVVSRSSRRIESGSIGEEEYETLYKQHFENMKTEQHGTEHVELSQIAENGQRGNADRPESLGLQGLEPLLAENHQATEALTIPSSDSAKNHDVFKGSLKRSNSSPSIMSGSSDTLSPRDSISDVVQFGPLLKTDKPKLAENQSVENRTTSVTNVDKTDTVVQKDTSSIKPSVDFVKKDSEKSTATVEKPQTSTDKAVKFDMGDDDGASKEFTSMLTKQLSPSPASSEASSTMDDVADLPAYLRRARGFTVSGPSSSSHAREGFGHKLHILGVGQGVGTGLKDSSRVGVNPSFVFLQLYHTGQIQVNEMPLLLPHNEQVERSIKMLDHIFPYETHKIGIIYVGKNQPKDEKAILGNQYGSERYMRFVQSLGTLLRLKDCNPQVTYLGGLDTKGNDGEFTYSWQDESTQLIFHIATLMPNKETDPNCNFKKAHIGNDYVTVVYNDSEEEYKIGVIKGQFNYVNIVIRPLDYESNAVTLQAKEDIAGTLGHTDTKIISDHNLAALIRQIAIHCNLASMVLQRQASQPQDPFANNWLERLRKIRRMKTLVDPVVQSPDSPTRNMENFTQYV
ncbi:tuberin-like isoform X2 [Mya arenaria]|uniref:tuberin-like isoform X2 n=1 Tax=Mya arenaria TaxID=6604 RepID=UPI0022E0AAE4|nr:tuberin-like isoform X2 [Mya arenaria]